MKIIYLLLLILSTTLVSAVTISPPFTRQVWNIIETQDGLLNDSLIKLNDTHLKYTAYFNETMKSKLLSDYSSGVPVFKQEDTPTKCVRYDMTSLKDEKPCLEEKYNLTNVRKVDFKNDTFEVLFPLENGIWEFFNESTIVEITNMSLGVFNNTFYNATGNYVQLNLSLSSNGTYTGIVQNFTSIPDSEGDQINVTTETTLPVLTNISVRLRQNDFNLFGNVSFYFDFDTLFSDNTSADIIGPWDNQKVVGGCGLNSTAGRNGMEFTSGCFFDGEDFPRNSGGQDLFNKNKTVSAWIYVRTLGQINNIFSMGCSIGCATPYLLLQVNANNRLAAFGTKNGGGFDYLESNGVLIANKWYQVTFTNRVGDGVRGFHTFINGTEVTYLAGTDGNYTDRNNDTGNDAFYVGVGFNTDYFEGIISDVIFWNRSLTDTEILNHYNSQLWSNYSDPCDVSLNATGCLFNRTGNLTQPKFTFTTGNVSVTPIEFNYTYTIQNATAAEPPADSCTYTSGNWIITDHCTLTTEKYNVCPNYVNVSSGASLNLTGTSEVNTSYIWIYPQLGLGYTFQIYPTAGFHAFGEGNC